MKVLIVEDDFGSRKLLQTILEEYAECDLAVNGEEALEAFKLAWQEKQPYNLICLDIMMPKVNGLEVLTRIREYEKSIGVKPAAGAKIIMITVLGDPKNVIQALYKGGATSYIVKPIKKETIINEINKLGLIE
jgi:two-component system chemotaxis response regulator CheY